MCAAFWSMQVFKFWLDVMTIPWKMTAATAPVADSMQVVVAAVSDPVTVAKLDPIHAEDIPNMVSALRPI